MSEKDVIYIELKGESCCARCGFETVALFETNRFHCPFCGLLIIRKRKRKSSGIQKLQEDEMKEWFLVNIVHY